MGETSLCGKVIQENFNNNNLSEIDGRTMAAAFRKFDIVERYIINESW